MAAAKATGASVSDLLGVFGQAMNTFEGTAEVAGRVNAVLGSDLLNSVDLLNASEEERIRMMIQSIALSGRSWESMGRFEKQALASAAGISDMTTANQIFGQSLSEYDTAQAAARANAMTQEEMAEQTRLNTSAQDALAVTMQSLAIATGPLVSLINDFMEGVLKLQEEHSKFLPIIFGIIGAFFAMNVIMKAVLFTEKMLAISKAVLGLTSVEATAATTGLTKAQVRLKIAAANTMMALGGAAGIFMILTEMGVPLGWALGAAAVGFGLIRIAMTRGGKLAIAMKVLSMALMAIGTAITMRRSPPLYLLLPIVAGGIWLIGKAAASGALGLAVLAAAMFFIGPAVKKMGEGVMMAAIGVGIMFTSLASIPPTQLFAIALAIGALGLAFQGVGLIMLNPLVALGLMGFAAGLFAIGEAFKNITADKISALRDFVEYTKGLDENAGFNLGMLGYGVRHISWGLAFLDPEKAAAFSEVMGASVEFSKASSPETVESATKLAGVIKEVAATKVSLSNVFMLNALGNLVDVLTKATQPAAGAAAGGAGGTSPTTVVLELDGRQLGKTVVELINKKYDLRLAR